MDNIGDGIAVYGPVGPNQTTSYVVQIDGSPESQTFSAVNQFYRSQQILFFSTGLGGGPHTVFMKLGGAGDGELAIDFANVYTAPSIGGRFVMSLRLSMLFLMLSISYLLSATPPVNSSGTSLTQAEMFSSIPPGIIAALAILAALAIGGVVVSVSLFMHRIPGKPQLQYTQTLQLIGPSEIQAFQPTSYTPSSIAYSTIAQSSDSRRWNSDPSMQYGN